MGETWISTAASSSLSGRASRDTVPELLLRRALHRCGLRYRVHVRIGSRMTADVVFGPAKVAVFVDGCFWHSCPQHGTMPRSNEEFWQAKLARDRGRDAAV